MATLKCLACGHDNDVGNESCSSCSSSLNLKLCSACEAINANDAERCHSCNAELRVEPEFVAFELDAPELRRLAEEAAPSGKALPAVWRLATGQARKRSARSTAVLAVLPLVVGGAAYYLYASEVPTQPQAARKVEAAQKSEPQPQPELVPAREPARQPAAELAPAPAASVKIAPPRAAAALSRSAPPPEPKRTTAAVTHTRAGSANAAKRTVPVETPIKTTTGALPVVAVPAVTVPVVVAAPAPAASADIMPVSDSAAGRTSVTQTKADLTEPAITTTTTTPPAAAAQRTVPAEGRNDEPAGCVPAVVALGLCKSK